MAAEDERVVVPAADERAEDEEALVQVPNLALHPVPQYAALEPHHPADEQQFPKMLP